MESQRALHWLQVRREDLSVFHHPMGGTHQRSLNIRDHHWSLVWMDGDPPGVQGDYDKGGSL